MTLESVLLACSLAGYVAASALAILRLVRPTKKGEAPLVAAAAFAAGCTAAVLLLHALRLERVPAFGRYESIACYTLALTVAFLVLAARRRVPGLSALVLPFVTVLLAIAIPAARTPCEPDVAYPNGWLLLHVAAAFSGFALFTVSSLLAAAYLVQDHNLKHKNFGLLFERLPSLSVLDHLMHRQMGMGFLLLTAAIVFGVRLVDLSGGGAEWVADPKVVATLATWVVHGLLLHVRGNIGRHGRSIALATLVGLLFVLFTFFGVGTLAASRHSFALSAISGT